MTDRIDRQALVRARPQPAARARLPRRLPVVGRARSGVHLLERSHPASLSLQNRSARSLGGSSPPSRPPPGCSRAPGPARFCLARLTEAAFRRARRAADVAGRGLVCPCSGPRDSPQIRPGSRLPLLPATNPGGGAARGVLPSHRVSLRAAPVMSCCSCVSSQGGIFDRATRVRGVAIGIAGARGCSVCRRLQRRGECGSPATKRPHIVIIGIDSLRDDLVSRTRRGGNTEYPRLPQRLAPFQGRHEPLARTYASWVPS